MHCNIDVYVIHEDTNHYFAYFSKISWDMFPSNRLFLISEGVKYSSSYSSFYLDDISNNAYIKRFIMIVVD